MNQRNRSSRLTPLRTFVLISVAVVATFSGNQTLLARPTTLGLQLPFPVHAAPQAATDSLSLASGIELVRVRLTIDSSGRVSSLAPTQVMRTERLLRLQRYFSRVTFEPGRLNDSARTCELMAEIVLSSDSAFTSVRYPIGSDTQVSAQDLYRSSLVENGVQAATWKRFPWFHASVPSADTIVLPRFALIRINLSVRGGIVGRELVLTNFPGFSEQLVNASNWAAYQPAKVEGKTVPSTNFLLVTFYPTVSYPTKPLVASKPDTSTIHRKYLLRMLPDSLGYMSEPIPRAPVAVDISAKVPPQQIGKSFTFSCTVDTAGFVRLSSPYPDSTGIPKLCSDAAKLIRLYPALDFKGQPKPFEGYVEAETLNGANVRIRYHWLL